MPSKGGSRASHGTIAIAEGAVSVQASGRGGSALAVAQDPEVLGAAVAVVASTPLVEDDPPVDTPEWAELYSRAVARYQEQRERTDREQQQAQRLWDEFLRIQGQEVPDGERSLVANEALHRELKRLAMTGQAASYERENVIGDPNQTFGIEIEFDGADPNAVARALYEAGLSSSARQEAYHSSLDPARLQANIKLACWVTKRAAELSDGAIPQERHALGSHRSPRDPDDGDRLLRRFADLIFVRPQDKLKLYWVYQRSAWQRTRRGAVA